MRVAPSQHASFAIAGAITTVERDPAGCIRASRRITPAPARRTDRALASIFAAYTVTAAPWLMFATGVGILLAYKLAHLISAVPAR